MTDTIVLMNYVYSLRIWTLQNMLTELKWVKHLIRMTENGIERQISTMLPGRRIRANPKLR